LLRGKTGFAGEFPFEVRSGTAFFPVHDFEFLCCSGVDRGDAGSGFKISERQDRVL
jgi:hypothetical protein